MPVVAVDDDNLCGFAVVPSQPVRSERPASTSAQNNDSITHATMVASAEQLTIREKPQADCTATHTAASTTVDTLLLLRQLPPRVRGQFEFIEKVETAG